MSHAYAGMANGALGLADMAARRSVHHKGNQMGDLNTLQKNRPVYFKLRMFWTQAGDRGAGEQGQRIFTTAPSLGDWFMVEVMTLRSRWHSKRTTMMGFNGNAKVQCVESDNWPPGLTGLDKLAICAAINDALPLATAPFHPTAVTRDLMLVGPTKELPRIW